MTTPAMALLAAASLAGAGAASSQSPDIHVLHAWSRPIPPGAPAGAGYMTLVNDSGHPVKLIGGASPAARTVEVHEMTLNGGVMRMRPVAGGLVVPAHGRVALQPGAYHLMLISPDHAYRLGEHIPVTLRLEGAPSISVDLIVQAGENAPMSATETN